MQQIEDKRKAPAKGQPKKKWAKAITILKKIFSPIIWLNLMGMVLAAFLLLEGLKWFLERYTHHGEEIEVPDVTGKSTEQAFDMLQELGIEGVIADSSYNRTMKPGAILEQRPAKGGHIKPGRTVLLTINSANAPTMMLPDIVGNSSKYEAQDRLTALGFKIGEIQYITGDKDWVYGMIVNGQQVYNGEKVDAGATITLQVGNGNTAPSNIDELGEEDDFDLSIQQIIGEFNELQTNDEYENDNIPEESYYEYE